MVLPFCSSLKRTVYSVCVAEIVDGDVRCNSPGLTASCVSAKLKLPGLLLVLGKSDTVLTLPLSSSQENDCDLDCVFF